MSNATIYDVAGAAKVSLATVSRVLNNPEKVKTETREKVLKVIEELGYRPNAIARGLASRKTTTVGVVVSDMTRASIAQMISGILDIAAQYKYSVKLFSILSGSSSKIEDCARNVIAEHVDGVLYLNDELDDKESSIVLEMFKANQMPVVLTNVSNNMDLPMVSIDYEQAGYEVTKSMIEEGRKNIYLLSTMRNYSINADKENGYVKAMKEAGLEPRVFRTSGDTSINKPHFNTFFDQNPVDGTIGVRDSIAISFMNVAREKGKSIPKDISVVGFQNTKYAMLSRPLLTSIDIPVYDIGAVSMRLLTKLMNNEVVNEKKVILPHKVIKRETTIK